MAFHRPLKLDQSPEAKRLRKITRTHDGVQYASTLEADYAAHLDVLVQNKGSSLDFWLRQVPFRLGKDAVYRTDFVVFFRHADKYACTAVDVKGIETREFRRIRKLWKKYGPMPLYVVTRKRKQWCTEVIEREE